MEKHSLLQDNVRRLGETVIIMVVCFLITSWLVQPLFGATQQSVDIRKKTELHELAKTLQFYYTDNDEFPSARKNGGFCEIDKRYPGQGVCLSELLRDGYYDALPVSPNDAPYWYFRFTDFVAVGSDLPISNTDTICVLPNGFEFWCVKIYK